MNTPHRFALFMLIPAGVGVTISLLIGWEPWHAAAYAFALVTLPYSITLMIQVLTGAPFVALTAFALFGLD